MSTRDIAVIGAGPYGLSVAAHLSAQGLRPRVFGDTMGSWRNHMPTGMMLKSIPCASNLSAPAPGSEFSDYCAAHDIAPMGDDDIIPVEMFCDYGAWFAARNVPDVDPTRVRNVARTGADFEVTLTSGESFTAGGVVVATGLTDLPFVPAPLDEFYEPDAVCPERNLVSHTWDHPDLSVFRGKRVAIVGGGQSALGSAALMHEAGSDPTVLVRAGRVIWGSDPDTPPALLDRLRPWSTLGNGFSLRFAADGPDVIRRLPSAARLKILRTVLGPSGAWWLRDRVEGKVPIRLGRRVTRVQAEGEGVRLDLTVAGGSREHLDVDHVLVATGFHVDLDRLGFLDAGLRTQFERVQGSPLLNRAFESSVPNVFFTGLAAAATFGPVLRFVDGARYAAPRIGAALSDRLAPVG